MPIEIPEANIFLDDEDVIVGFIREFNQHAEYVPGDWIAHRLFVANPSPEAMGALVVAVNDLMHAQAPGDRLATLVRWALAETEWVAAALGHLPEDPSAQPAQTKEVAVPLLARFIEVRLGGDLLWGGSFVLGTKYLHWASHGRAPMVDDDAKRAVCELQQQWVEAHPGGANPDVIIPEEPWQKGPFRAYRIWINFYSALVVGMQQRHPGLVERLVDFDLDSQLRHHPEWTVRNTILRVLDKYFWRKGKSLRRQQAQG